MSGPPSGPSRRTSPTSGSGSAAPDGCGSPSNGVTVIGHGTSYLRGAYGRRGPTPRWTTGAHVATTPTQQSGLRSLQPQQWRSFFAAWLGYFLDGFDFILITLVLTEIAEEFQLDLPTAATLVSAAFVSRWFGGLVLGAIGDRFGRKPAMIISIWCFAVGSLLCGFAWGYWSMFAFRALVGIGMAGEYGSSATFAMESWPQALRNRASGMLLSAYPVGVVVASLLYAVIVPSLGWRWMFYIGILPVVLALVMRRSLPEAAEWQREVGERAEATTFQILFGTRQRALLNTVIGIVIAVCLVLVFSKAAGPATWLLAIIVGAGFIAYLVQMAGRLWPMTVALVVTVFAAFLYSWPIQSLLPTYLKTDLGYNPAAVSTVLLWAGLGYAAGSVAAGMLGDRIGTRRAYLTGLLVSLLVIAPVFLIGGSSFVLLSVLLFALQFTSQGISGLLPKFITDHFPTRLRAAGLGLTYNIGALGGALAPVIGATLAQRFGGLGTALMVLAIAFTIVVAVFVGFNVPARIGKALRVESDAPALQEGAR
ncbi:MFS transporter [Enemella evansiae]|uniref:MFS transporter n=1 Tax=Enemella evansiae TaxID=2016499 RepID=A0A255GK99_9ACTN|nr:MFS transporter [Enemella evansiae]OYO16356.1 MFS transporter [Enemella evansiae]